MLPLDFTKNQTEVVSQHLSGGDVTNTGTLFDGVASSDMQPSSEAGTIYQNESSTEQESEDDAEEMTAYGLSASNIRQVESGIKPRSQYRRGKFKFKKSEPNRVYLQVLIQHGKELERTPNFEINFDSLSC